MKLEFVSRVEKPAQDAVASAIELIRQEVQKTRYDAKEKWLKFGVSYNENQNALQFLKSVKSALWSQHRRNYGASRTFSVLIRQEDGEPVLYVHTDIY